MKKKYLVWLDIPNFGIGSIQKSILISRHYFRPCALIYKLIAAFWLNRFSKNKTIDYYLLIKISKR